LPKQIYKNASFGQKTLVKASKMEQGLHWNWFEAKKIEHSNKN
jgi:hypothetical protein